MSKVIVTLQEQDLVDLHAILLDEDAAQALSFLRDRIAAGLPRRGTAACDSSRRNPYLLKPEGPA